MLILKKNTCFVLFPVTASVEPVKRAEDKEPSYITVLAVEVFIIQNFVIIADLFPDSFGLRNRNGGKMHIFSSIERQTKTTVWIPLTCFITNTFCLAASLVCLSIQVSCSRLLMKTSRISLIISIIWCPRTRTHTTHTCHKTIKSRPVWVPLSRCKYSLKLIWQAIILLKGSITSTYCCLVFVGVKTIYVMTKRPKQTSEFRI